MVTNKTDLPLTVPDRFIVEWHKNNRLGQAFLNRYPHLGSNPDLFYCTDPAKAAVMILQQYSTYDFTGL